MPFESRIYWFLINYLLGDGNGFVSGEKWEGHESEVSVGVVSGRGGIEGALIEWIEPATTRAFAEEWMEKNDGPRQ